jgi:hypothetical protein
VPNPYPDHRRLAPIPRGLYERLRAAAVADNRSLARETIYVLEIGLARLAAVPRTPHDVAAPRGAEDAAIPWSRYVR